MLLRGSNSNGFLARVGTSRLLQVVVREEGLTDLTLVTRMDFGHTDPQWVLPLGVLP